MKALRKQTAAWNKKANEHKQKICGIAACQLGDKDREFLAVAATRPSCTVDSTVKAHP
jgi:hypothetical protein